MTKMDLIERISKNFDLTKKEAEIAVNTVFEAISEALDKGEKVELRGFGVFKVREKRARIGRNPRTGEKVEVPPKRVPYFKAGKELKEAVNRNQ